MEQYHQITLTEWTEVKARLRRAALNAANGFVELGYELRMIEEQELYRAGGYKSIAEFADSEPEFGLSAATVSRLININRQFGDPDEPKRLKLEFTRMGMSKLSEMLTIPMGDREMIRPETKRDDIRELKRLEREAETDSDLAKIINLFFEEFSDLLKELRSSRAYAEGDTAGMVEIVNPSGSRSYRKSGLMLMMYEDSIKYKAAGHSPETVKWSEFFTIADRIEVTDEREEYEAEESEETQEADEAADRGSGSEGEADGSREDDAEPAEGQTETIQNDVGGEEDEESGNDETVEDDEAEAVEEVSDDAPEAAPVEEPEEKFGGMNPPVDKSENCAGANAEESAETLNEKPDEIIVDETGNPSPEDVSFKEYWDMQKQASKLCDNLKNDVEEYCDWDTALSRIEELKELLYRLQKADAKK